MIIILVAEDDDMSRDMLSRRLAKAGYVVIETKDGTQAMEAARTEKPDLILMDILMPKMDGVEAARWLKKDAKTAGIPIIALTALNSAADVRRAFQAGCNDYQTKPVDLPTLLTKIRKHLATEKVAGG